MEEVDNIIIQSLRNLGCNIDEEIVSLKQFTDEIVVKAAVCCLDAISPGMGLPKTLPPSMSLRLRTAAIIAEAVKDLDYRGDMGYQTILYSNEVEIRRMFMFLVERLPRDNEKALQTKAKGQFEILQTEIRDTITALLQASKTSHKAKHYIPFHSRPLYVPKTQSLDVPQDLKEYWARYLPPVTDQCSNDELIPSLIVYNDCNDQTLKLLSPGTVQKELLESFKNLTVAKEIITEPYTNTENKSDDIAIKTEPVETLQEKVSELTVEDIQNTARAVAADIEQLKEDNQNLEADIAILVAKDQQIEEQTKLENEALDNSVRQLKIKTRTHKLLPSKDENIIKLEEMVALSTDKLASLASQWDKHRRALIVEYRNLREQTGLNQIEQRKYDQKLNAEKQKLKDLQEDLIIKDSICVQLQEECTKMSSKGNRAAYTQRIMEIIGNIRKQCNEIDKILKDTKDLQKHINTLTGQLERSFVLADEIIFRDAKQEETARRAYKLLATLHNDCAELIQVAKQTGAIVRETRDLQEQVDSERSRDTATRLTRITSDLEEVRRETKLLQESMSKID